MKRASKYRHWYDGLMQQARQRGPLNEYCEKHHVKPRCFGGSDAVSNIVVLTYREHFLAHWLLVKFVRGKERRKQMHYALANMRRSGKGRKIISGWQYAVARRAHRDAMVGCPRSPETRAKLRAAFSTPQARAKQSAALKGRKHTPEHRAKNSAAHTGYKHSAEAREKIRVALTGYKHSPEARANMSGRQLSPKTRAKIRAALTGRNRSWANIVKRDLNRGWKLVNEGHLVR